MVWLCSLLAMWPWASHSTVLGAHLRKPMGYKENSVKWKSTWSFLLGAWHLQLIRMVLWNVRAGRGSRDDLILVSDFTGRVN